MKKGFDLKKFQQIAKNGRKSKVFQSTLKDLQAYNNRLMDFAVDSGLSNLSGYFSKKGGLGYDGMFLSNSKLKTPSLVKK